MTIGKFPTVATLLSAGIVGTAVLFKFRPAPGEPVDEVPVPVNTDPKTVNWLAPIIENNPDINKYFDVDG